MCLKLMVSVLCLSSLLSGCSLLEKKMPEEVRERIAKTVRVDVNNLNEEDKVILDSKKKELLKALDDMGYDPVFIGGYHIDLGCNLFFEKSLPYVKTGRVKHNEFFILRDYSRQLEDKKTTNSDFCDPLKNKLIHANKQSGSFYQKLYVVTFNPNEDKKDGWDISLKSGRFIPVSSKHNLDYKAFDYIELKGAENPKELFLAYGCSKYSVPVSKFDDKGNIVYEHKIEQEKVVSQYVGEMDEYMEKNLASGALRRSEHWVNCQERVNFIKIK